MVDMTDLQDEYDRKVNRMLPQVAAAVGGWPIRFDHCFGRVVLDNVFEDEWYGHVESPAYKNLSEAQIREAIEIADRMLQEGRPAVEELNDKSLEYRGKL
ncbi:hypothetical protein SAMN06264855_14213 [Halorubrum vacuolatum]|uniref:Uncharacterized protein n=2 Tax=Halorubrum vacuolatum TaxID=63740 RepID=A0A238YGX6_HALVU|nr:hypothetical protein SAMN06264855_14213 [Halorubrum vacuolatum]